MADQKEQMRTQREVIRAHTYPILAATATIALVVIAVSLWQIATYIELHKHCIQLQITARDNQ